jgi:GT2 family glycosyltransferase
MEPVKVALLCPTAQTINPQVFKHALAMVSYASANNVHITQIGLTERTLIHSARNQLALGFKASDCEWAFWMDSDMLFPAPTIVKLLETAKACDTKFVTGVYYQRLGQHLPVLWRKNPVLLDGSEAPLSEDVKKDPRGAYMHHFILPSGKEPLKADVAGFGCILMHRELVEKIEYPYFKTISDDCSEDFYFCIKAREAGYQLWADPSITLYHEGQPQWISKDNCVVDEARLQQIKI